MSEITLALVLKLSATGMAAIVTGFLSCLFKRIERKFQIDIKDSHEKRALRIVRLIVLALNQTMVSGLKKRGKFDAAAAAKALLVAKTKIAAILKKERLWKPDDWIVTAIEAEVSAAHK